MPRSGDTPVSEPIHPGALGAAPFTKSLPWLLLIGGVIGLLASFVLTIEKFTLATDPAYVPSCSIDPVLNCGSVMNTEQASAFGFPNSLVGITGFAVVAVTGAALLAGAEFAQWFWLALQTGITAAAIFVHWLIYQSLYTIGTLCPYCMIVWAVTIPIFWYLTLRNLGAAMTASRINDRIVAVIANNAPPLTIWALTIVGLIAERFWYHWSRLP